jgi:hypothetical protein
MLSTEQPHYAQDGGAEQRREQSEVINAIGLDWAVERHPRSLNADILQRHNQYSTQNGASYCSSSLHADSSWAVFLLQR